MNEIDWSKVPELISQAEADYKERFAGRSVRVESLTLLRRGLSHTHSSSASGVADTAPQWDGKFPQGVVVNLGNGGPSTCRLTPEGLQAIFSGAINRELTPAESIREMSDQDSVYSLNGPIYGFDGSIGQFQGLTNP